MLLSLQQSKNHKLMPLLNVPHGHGAIASGVKDTYE
jgi:hypothetical protein